MVLLLELEIGRESLISAWRLLESVLGSIPKRRQCKTTRPLKLV